MSKKRRHPADSINPKESYLSQTMCYEQDVCQGFLRKMPKNSKFWHLGEKSFQRYFLLNHKSQTMQIYKKNDPESEFTEYKYEDILEVSDQTKPLYQNNQAQLRWTFKFEVRCKQRSFTLLAASSDEKILWIYTFEWIIREH